MKIIGIGHYSRTGKDTLANFIVNDCERLGVRAKKVSLAWKLKQVCHELYGWAGLREPEYYDTKEGELMRDISIRALGMTPVEIWVAFGTPAVRENVYDRTWIDYILQTDHECDVLLVPDIRFENETTEFRNEGAKLVKAVREGYGPKNTVADRNLIEFDDWNLWCGGSMEDLQLQAKGLALWACDMNEFPQNSEGNSVYPSLDVMKAMEAPCVQ